MKDPWFDYGNMRVRTGLELIRVCLSFSTYFGLHTSNKYNSNLTFIAGLFCVSSTA